MKFSWIFAISLFSGYRSFRYATEKEGLALLSAFLTAGTVAGLAFGLVTYLAPGDPATTAPIAVALAFVWYAWQGLTVHTLSDTLTRRVAIEYGLFGLISVYLIAIDIVMRRAV